MNFSHPEERQQFKDMAARFIADKYALADRLKAAAGDSGFSAERWGDFAELGLVGALFGEADGGFGGAPFDIAVLFEELGRGLVNEPFLPNLMAGSLIAALGSEAQKALIADVVAGSVQLSLAHGEPQSRYDAELVETRAVKTAGGWRLSGHKSVVINGAAADHLVVSARLSGEAWDQEGIALFLVPADAAGVNRTGYSSIDGLGAAEIRLDNVDLPEEAALGTPGKAWPALEKVLALGCLALSAEAIGLMEKCRDLTIDYLKTRKQFGVEIGKFQALQHRMATVLLEIEQARSSVINVAGRFDATRKEREMAASAAKSMVGRIGKLVAEEAIQMHGGIAMTWEYAVGHFAKRLIMIDSQLGDVDHHLARYIALSRG
ncbi:acyl-CoA dehydrogenase family protein [Rhizobium alvei]|uniref:Acyl-CoA dehydrogenase n=1 Tax=Rhizobium alvei TaxID=1132659 RepID=A0ABT8YH48_9HYPH|nr:acyl-CoA dehydrogenase [Rhizobium alvei]MDO6963005.1 acyl-CoA dehydrogenase [Rhizobium alvei]